MFCQSKVTYNIIINKWISLRSKVPWFLFWIVWSTFKTRQLIFKVENIIGLLVSECSVFIFSQNINVIIIFLFPGTRFNCWNLVNLSYRIVSGLLSFNFFTGNLNVWISSTLEVILLFNVWVNFILPFTVVVIKWEEDFIRCSLSNFLILCRECNGRHIIFEKC